MLQPRAINSASGLVSPRMNGTTVSLSQWAYAPCRRARSSVGMAPVRPALGVEGVDAVELDPAGVDQVGDGVDHAVVLEVPGPPGLAGEDQHRPTLVAVADHGQVRSLPSPSGRSTWWRFTDRP